jgi:hypothetical protein
MTNLRDQMAPLLKDFQAANGRGNLLSANITLIKIVDLLMTHIEHQTVQLHMQSFNNTASVPAYIGNHHNLTVGGDVDLTTTEGWYDETEAVFPIVTEKPKVDTTVVPASIISTSLGSDTVLKRRPGRPKVNK